jgi:hypothetical protein
MFGDEAVVRGQGVNRRLIRVRIGVRKSSSWLVVMASASG